MIKIVHTYWNEIEKDLLHQEGGGWTRWKCEREVNEIQVKAPKLPRFPTRHVLEQARP